MDVNTGGWDVEKLLSNFGMTQTMTILSSVRPPNQEAGEDSLVFTLAGNGVFSVRKAYEAIAQEGTPLQQHSGEVWKLIWDKGELVPRIRLFAWKLMHEALPLTKVIQSRTGKVGPIYATYGQAEEDLSHMLWQCAFSRCC